MGVKRSPRHNCWLKYCQWVLHNFTKCSTQVSQIEHYYTVFRRKTIELHFLSQVVILLTSCSDSNTLLTNNTMICKDENILYFYSTLNLVVPRTAWKRIDTATKIQPKRVMRGRNCRAMLNKSLGSISGRLWSWLYKPYDFYGSWLTIQVYLLALKRLFYIMIHLAKAYTLRLYILCDHTVENLVLSPNLQVTAPIEFVVEPESTHVDGIHKTLAPSKELNLALPLRRKSRLKGSSIGPTGWKASF